jgi:hypothetical protein
MTVEQMRNEVVTKKLKLAQAVPDRLPTHAFELISPAMAEDWLEKYNTHNRNMKRRKLSGYVQDMQAGRWRGTNGEPIIFDAEGRLTDGQQRLQAVVLSGLSIIALVVRGVPVDCYITVDTGAPKSVADARRDDRNGTLLSSTARLVKAWLEDNIRGDDSGSLCATNSSISDVIYDLNPDLAEAVNWMAKSEARKLINGTVGAFVLYAAIASGKREQGIHFMQRLGDGVELREGDPIYTLRKSMVRNSLSHKKMPRHFVLAFAVKAWNAHIHHTPLWHLRLTAEERFPTIVIPEQLANKAWS